MYDIDYRSVIKGVGAKKSLGQNFLINKEIARLEAQYAKGRNVVEIGPGFGILTNELCSVAKSVLAVEYDKNIFEFLNDNMRFKNLRLINSDFFRVPKKELKNIEILVSNIPYKLSSKTVFWLAGKSIPAVLCLQKEFVEHMLAKPNTRKYSRLSVVCSLQFTVHQIVDVAPNNFYPEPKVSSIVVYVKAQKMLEKKTIDTIALLMMHKKKKIRNAILDSVNGLSISKTKALEIIAKINGKEKRAFQLEPSEIKEIAEQINALLE